MSFKDLRERMFLRSWIFFFSFGGACVQEIFLISFFPHLFYPFLHICETLVNTVQLRERIIKNCEGHIWRLISMTVIAQFLSGVRMF